MASAFTSLFLIFNILFFSLTQGQGPTPSPAMNSATSPPAAMDSATSPPPAMDSATSPPAAMDSATSPPPAMDSATSPPPAMNSATSPPAAMNSATSPPPGLNCSGCRVNPIGLTSCGFVISGGVLPRFVRLCCRALQSLTREEGFACLCNLINRNAINTGNLDIRGAVDRAINVCSNI
ncbi:hypothetical protein AgCh_016664 [Apium graveolens]